MGRIRRESLPLNFTLNSRWKVQKKIGEGNFGLLYLVEDLREGNNRQAVLKIQKKRSRFGGPSLVLLDNEVEFLKEAWNCEKNLKCIAQLFETGFLPEMYSTAPYMIIERLGPSLSRLLVESDGKLPSKMIFRLALGMVRALQEMHSLGWAHRDVKPSNFVLSMSESEHREPSESDSLYVYILDFGRAKRFLDANNKWISRENFCEFGGPVNYASIDAHQKKEHGPLDDLQSVLYVISHFSEGTLPWLHFRNPAETCWMKRITPDLLLYRNLPCEIRTIQEYIFSTEYGVMPDYMFISELLNTALEKS